MPGAFQKLFKLDKGQMKLPADISEIIQIIDDGEMPRTGGLLKYDFRKKDYLMIAIGGGLFGGWFLWATVITAIKDGIAGAWLTGVFAFAGLWYAVINFILYVAAKKGRAYVLLTDKYFLMREGRSIKYYLWPEIYCLKLTGVKDFNENISWERIRFFYKKSINVVLRFRHLPSKSKLLLAQQVNRYWQRFGGEAVSVSDAVRDSIQKTHA